MSRNKSSILKGRSTLVENRLKKKIQDIFISLEVSKFHSTFQFFQSGWQIFNQIPSNKKWFLYYFCLVFKNPKLFSNKTPFHQNFEWKQVKEKCWPWLEVHVNVLPPSHQTLSFVLVLSRFGLFDFGREALTDQTRDTKFLIMTKQKKKSLLVNLKKLMFYNQTTS